MPSARPVFFVSDGTGITAETLGNTLLTQFDGLDFDKTILPFVNTAERAKSTVDYINFVGDQTGQRPLVFEDGGQRRDFVYVGDVARAFCDALVHPDVNGHVLNIGSGRSRSVTEVARSIARAMNRNDIEPEVVDKSRIGDIRHCFCDGGKAAEVLGFRAEKDFHEGIAELAEWVAGQEAQDRVDQARSELEARGLVS
mgnify:CR=1 FL=1